MVKWEYVCITNNNHRIFQEELNNYGKAGWELVNVLGLDGYHVAYLKKQSNL